MWMRSESKRRNCTIGSKWLRQGGAFPVENPVPDSRDGGENSKSKIGAEEIYDPNKSGIGEIRG